MTDLGRTVVLRSGEGKDLSAMGIQLSLKAVSEDTGGAFYLMEYQAPPGFGGPPPHTHQRMIEAFYVLEGELTVQVDQRTITAAPGGFVLIGQGSVHTFSNQGDAVARFLVVGTPGGFEKYFQELPAVIAQHGYPPPPDVIADLGDRYDFQTVAPPT